MRSASHFPDGDPSTAHNWMMTLSELEPLSAAPYAALSPDTVIAAAEWIGLVPDGRVLALNSYENRVYQVGLEDRDPVVLKFYRPERWTDAAIIEEHAFALELAAAEIPVVAPLQVKGQTLFEIQAFRFAAYPRRGGRWPDLDTSDDRILMGRFLGRMHRVGATRPFHSRPALSLVPMAVSAAQSVLAGDWLPAHQVERYRDVADRIIERISEQCDAAFGLRSLRIHGDCHRGNILWTQQGPHFVDLDDCMTGPAVQDLWMLLSGSADELRRQIADLLEGYEQFYAFDRRELSLIEALRAYRMLHYAAWLGRRWQDPAFPKAFPWFGEARYWEEHVRQLIEQLELMEQGTIAW